MYATYTNTNITTTAPLPPHHQEMEEYRAKRVRGAIEDPMELIMQGEKVGEDGLLALPRTPSPL
jgi:hypothetical protein